MRDFLAEMMSTTSHFMTSQHDDTITQMTSHNNDFTINPLENDDFTLMTLENGGDISIMTSQIPGMISPVLDIDGNGQYEELVDFEEVYGRMVSESNASEKSREEVRF